MGRGFYVSLRRKTRRRNIVCRTGWTKSATDCLQKLQEAKDGQQVEQLRVAVLGRKGELTAIMRTMGSLKPEERPAFGQKVNQLRQRLEEALDNKAQEIREREKEQRLKDETLDVSIPGLRPELGVEHPITATMNKIVETFVGWAFPWWKDRRSS